MKRDVLQFKSLYFDCCLEKNLSQAYVLYRLRWLIILGVRLDLGEIKRLCYDASPSVTFRSLVLNPTGTIDSV